MSKRKKDEDPEGHELPGPTSDAIRAGQVPAPTTYIRPDLPEEAPAPVDVVFGSGYGLGQGPTRRRDGTIPGESDQHGHILAVVQLDGALERLHGALEMAHMHTESAAQLSPTAMGTGTGGMTDWINGLRQELHGRIAEVARAQGIVKNVLENLG